MKNVMRNAIVLLMLLHDLSPPLIVEGFIMWIRGYGCTPIRVLYYLLPTDWINQFRKG